MLRSPKLQKWASDPEWAQNGGSQNCTPPNFFGFGVTCRYTTYGSRVIHIIYTGEGTDPQPRGSRPTEPDLQRHPYTMKLKNEFSFGPSQDRSLLLLTVQKRTNLLPPAGSRAAISQLFSPQSSHCIDCTIRPPKFGIAFVYFQMRLQNCEERLLTSSCLSVPSLCFVCSRGTTRLSLDRFS